MSAGDADRRALFERHAAELEDFWGRRLNEPRFERPFTLFGRPGLATSNQPELLAAIDLALPLYSTAAPTDRPPLTVQFVVRETPQPLDPPPDNLPAITQYAGHGDWLSIQIGGWGHVHIDRVRGEAFAVLTPALAARPELVSRALVNTIFTNMLFGQGFAMLHCTGLLRDGRRGPDGRTAVLLLMAPHDSGKSTTAFRLVQAGYRLISDSQIYVSPDGDRLQLLGFPVGRLKLRSDTLPHFPELAGRLQPEPVRDEIKHVLDVRQWAPAQVVETAVYPDAIDLCLLARNGRAGTHLQPATPEEVWPTIMHNSIHYDRWPIWERQLQQTERVVRRARLHHLSLGRDPDGILAALDGLDG